MIGGENMKRNNMLIILFIFVMSLTLTACDNDTTNIINDDIVQPSEVQQEISNSDSDETSLKSLEKYNEFIKKAETIEKYSKENYETATTQVELNTESYNVYVKWDSLLNEVYQYLKNTMNSDDFSVLEAEEVEWIKEKEKGIEEAAAEWAGGSGEPMARNSAGIKYTSERCYHLISLVQQCK